MKVDFFNVDKEYMDYLRQFDNRIPELVYTERNKFVCGIVLTIDNYNYYVPVSSNTNRFRSSYLIHDYHNKPVSSLRFSFMVPVPDECISRKIINEEPDIKYKRL